MEIKLRYVNEQDKWIIYNWSNDVTTRKMSFNSKEISKEQHDLWFESLLASSRCWIAELAEGSLPVGMFRVNGEGIVGISVSGDYRGKGIGTSILEEAIKLLEREKETYHISDLVAFIKIVNEPSISLFKKAGFGCEGITEYSGSVCYKYVYKL